jgi:uncharacterized protein (TIGR02466 family)
MQNDSIQSLFSIPVFVGDISVDPGEADFVRHLPFLPLKNKTAAMTASKHILDMEPLGRLKSAIDQKVQSYVKSTFSPQESIQFVMTTSWATRHKTGDWANAHDHSNSLVSGIVYLDVDQDSGDLVFDKIIENLGLRLLHIDPYKYTPFNSPNWGLTPTTNQIVIFPSNLPHRATTNNSTIDRHCIAFNYFVKGTLGQGEGELIIT